MLKTVHLQFHGPDSSRKSHDPPFLNPKNHKWEPICFDFRKCFPAQINFHETYNINMLRNKNKNNTATEHHFAVDLISDLLYRESVLPEYVSTWPGRNEISFREQLTKNMTLLLVPHWFYLSIHIWKSKLMLILPPTACVKTSSLTWHKHESILFTISWSWNGREINFRMRPMEKN